MSTRTICNIVTGRKAIDGDGVRLVRVLGTSTVREFDPFLMLDAFDSRNPEEYKRGFPMHPHRGIETVTYLVRGEMSHQDSLGHSETLTGGDVQWMTAGSGILHQEIPLSSPHLLGLQLWINMPAQHKMDPPRYHTVTSDLIPLVQEADTTVRVISGTYKGTRGAIQAPYVPVRFLDVQMLPDAVWSVDTDPEDTVFTYILEGESSFGADDRSVPRRSAVLFSSGDTLTIRASMEGARHIIGSGKPLHEPVAWGGPMVMNTEEELRAAFKELEEGTFIK